MERYGLPEQNHESQNFFRGTMKEEIHEILSINTNLITEIATILSHIGKLNIEYDAENKSFKVYVSNVHKKILEEELSDNLEPSIGTSPNDALLKYFHQLGINLDRFNNVSERQIQILATEIKLVAQIAEDLSGIGKLEVEFDSKNGVFVVYLSEINERFKKFENILTFEPSKSISCSDAINKHHRNFDQIIENMAKRKN